MTDKDTLMNLIDEYAEVRHINGCWVYNTKTAAARQAVIEALSGVQALSAAPAGWKLVPVKPDISMQIAAKKADMDHSPLPDWLVSDWPEFLRIWNAMLAASPTPTPPALSAAPAGFVPVAAFDRLHAHAESLAARLLAAEQAAPKAAPGEPDGYKQALGSNNCMQCCVSYMLGLPVGDVPHFADGGGWGQFARFVESKGYSAVMLPGEHEPEADYLASGRTERGTSHMVVMNDGKLVFDPHPSNAGLSSVQCVWLLAKRAAPQQEAQEPSRDAKTWCSYVAGMIGCYLKKPDESAEVRAIAGIIERRLWALPAPQPAPAPLSEREAFERDWEKRHAPAPINSRTRDDGRYGDSSIQDAWESWQARAALAAQGGTP